MWSEEYRCVVNFLFRVETDKEYILRYNETVDSIFLCVQGLKFSKKMMEDVDWLEWGTWNGDVAGEENRVYSRYRNTNDWEKNMEYVCNG